MKNNFILVLSIITIIVFTSVLFPSKVDPEWRALGEKHKNKFPNDPEKKAIFLAGIVGEFLFQMKVHPNHNHMGRAAAFDRYGNSEVGNCGYIAEIMRNVFKGAGFDDSQVFKINVEKEGFNKYNHKLLIENNVNHVVFGVVAKGKPIVFELWDYGRKNKSFRGFYKSKFSGMDLNVWLNMMQRYNYSLYSYGDDNLKKINSTDIDVFLRTEELKNSKRYKKRNLKDNKTYVVDESTRIENEFRTLYPRWLNATKSPGAKIKVTANAVKLGPDKYKVASETWRVAEAGRLKGKLYRSGSGEWVMTLAELKSAVANYKKDLRIQ